MPNDCAALAAAWQPGGAWDADSGGDANQDLTAASGGLMVEADIINVSEGINFSIPVTALDNFFAANEINHVSPGDTSLSLDAAEPVAMLIANDDFYQLAFESGVDAVSAVLMKVELIGTYALDTFVAGKSEMILSQPTRRFYFDPGSVDTSPPFNTDRFVELCPESIYGGTEIESDIFDRESLFDYSYYGNGTSKNSPRPPTLPDPAICGSVFVQSISLPSNQIEPPSITQSDNYMVSTTPVAAVTESGYVITRFLDSRPLLGTQINSNQTVQLMGLPIIGVSLQQFTNAGAALGLLAQYGGSAQMKSKVSVVE